jgi:hypothetical protein
VKLVKEGARVVLDRSAVPAPALPDVALASAAWIWAA